MRVLAVTANKGGVGKSTLAFQVAAELARRGLRVLAVDADKQADLPRYPRGPRLAGVGLDAVLADPPASLDPRPYIGSVSDNLDLLGSSPRLADADLVLQSAEGGPFLIQRCLAVVAGAYDWAVIDTGHSEPVIAAVLVAADQLLMPTTASAPDARHAGDMLQTAVRVREELGLETGDLLQRSLITIWRRQHNGVADAEVIENLQDRCGRRWTPSRRSPTISWRVPGWWPATSPGSASSRRSTWTSRISPVWHPPSAGSSRAAASTTTSWPRCWAARSTGSGTPSPSAPGTPRGRTASPSGRGLASRCASSPARGLRGGVPERRGGPALHSRPAHLARLHQPLVLCLLSPRPGPGARLPPPGAAPLLHRCQPALHHLLRRGGGHRNDLRSLDPQGGPPSGLLALRRRHGARCAALLRWPP